MSVQVSTTVTSIVGISSAAFDDDGEVYHNHDHSSNDQQNKVGNGKDVADKSGSTTAPGCLIVSSNIVV